MGLIDIKGLPAVQELKEEGFHMIKPEEAGNQPVLRIAILNLMPLKQQTERQLLRRIAAAEKVAEVTFLRAESYTSTHVDPEHLNRYYQTFSQIQNQKWDGLIITGAPVEHMQFEEVAYWRELTEVMAWSKKNVRSVLHICWGAQAGLYYHYGISKQTLPEKQFGIFPHHIVKSCMLTQGMEDPFFAPHSRHTFTPKEEVEAVKDLKLIAYSQVAGVYLLLNEKERQIFVTGHSEYEAQTLAQEYHRDLDKGLPIQMPYHYFPDDDASKEPISIWARHSEALFNNWLKFYASPI